MRKSVILGYVGYFFRQPKSMRPKLSLCVQMPSLWQLIV